MTQTISPQTRNTTPFAKNNGSTEDHAIKTNSNEASELSFKEDPKDSNETSHIGAIDLHTNEDKKASSDKYFDTKDSSLKQLLHIADKIATYISSGLNVFAAFTQIIGIPEPMKKAISKFVDVFTNLSFVLYGADGCRIGIDKKNPYQALGFLMETTNVWFTNPKVKFLVRGAGTGTDQIWVATDKKLEEDHGIKEGTFDTWKDGFIKVPLICWNMLKEVAKDPIKTVFTLSPKGHNALISSIGDIAATLGYALTGQEKIFGTIRDVSSGLFDWEILLDKMPMRKVSGVLFILEFVFDFIARFMPTDNMRLFMNHLSIGSGRGALMCYKNSDPKSNKAPKDLSETSLSKKNNEVPIGQTSGELLAQAA